MNNYINIFLKRITILLSVFSVLLFTGCMDPHEIIDHKTDRGFTNSYAKDIEGVTSNDYERINIGYGKYGKYSLGPTDPRYRGIFTVSEESGEEIFNSYDWIYDDSFTIPDLGDVDTSSLQGEKWYFSYKFETDNFPLLICTYVRFNGKDTFVFDVQAH